MFEESLGYLRESDDWAKTVLIGGVLTLLGVLVVPAVLALGYLMRVLRGTMAGERTPPAFDELGEMAVDGLKAFVVTLVYGVVPSVVVLVFGGVGLIGLIGGSGVDGPGVGAALGGLTALLGLLLGFALSLVAMYVVPAALANYAETDRMGAAFDVRALRPVLTSGTYATAWLIGFAIAFAAGVVISALNVVPVLGVVAGAFVTFYALVAACYAVGTAWGELHPAAVIEETDASGERPAV